MDTLLYIAALMAFAPALLLMYAILRKYTYPAVQQPFFSDPSFFILFAVGLVAGTLLFALYTYLMATLMYVMLFSVLLVLAFMAILNLKRYHGKSDTVFYGYGLGLGVGCTFAFGFIYYLSKIAGVGSSGFTDYVELFLLALSLLMTISAIGTTIGEGVARLRITEFLLKGILMSVAFFVIFYAALAAAGTWMYYLGIAASVLVSAGMFYKTLVKDLSRVVREVLKMEGKKRDDLPK